MKNILLLLALCPVALFGQTTVWNYPQNVEKGLRTITQPSMAAQIGFLSDDLLEGRAMGSKGAAVAAQYIVSYLQEYGIAPLKAGDYFEPFSVFRTENGKYNSTGEGSETKLKNILGVIPGKISNEIIVIGAHYDHLGIAPGAVGDSIYNGADDNASGVSAVLQIAKAFVANGQQPLRTVIFAFWDGEERGTLGSKYFTTHFPEIKNVKGYINFDMIGRNNDESKPNHVVYFYTEPYTVFEQWQRSHIRHYSLQLAPQYKPWDAPVSGSDNRNFALLGIPIIWYHTDGHPDYHKVSDHADKINYPKAVEITQTAYLNAWFMATLRF